MKSPRYWALQQIHVLLQYPHKDVEMKSPRHWALQLVVAYLTLRILSVEMKSPRHWALQPKVLIHQDNDIKSRNEKPETLGIATFQE